ncbi:MAG TPA: DUF3500 domain-containing protein [Planctomycetaceae bacterium]|nr:DUF3500 domain-containing protein [Planctomycetaceae bacterium]
MKRSTSCPDCHAPEPVSRREFVRVVGTSAAAVAAGAALPSRLLADESAAPQSESLVKKLYDLLTVAQKQEICFPWDHTDDRGLLRTHVSNNWSITDVSTLSVGGDFFSKDQQDLIREIFLSLYNPDWHERIFKQLRDDADGYGKQQTIAIFGTPGSGKFEFVMTGRHLTIRCDGDSTEHVAFGGPIFYGHAASGFNETVGHPGNVFWHQAQKANKLFQMLSGKQREQALVEVAPQESQVEFKGKRQAIPGVPIAELSSDQKEHAKDVLKTLVEPYRRADQTEAVKMLDAQGGLDACHLAFYRKGQSGGSLDLGDDGEWDVWRIEGPSFVWHFRGVPHVHVWVNVADDSSPKLNAKG